MYGNFQNLQETTATNISLCNTSGASVTVYLSFPDYGQSFSEGAVLFGYSLAAKATITVGNRLIHPSGSILAYAGTANVIALSIDVLDDYGVFEPILT